MGMEPFVAAGDNAFGHLIASIPNPVANLQQAIAFKLGVAQKQAETQQAVAQAQEISTKLTRAQTFQRDLQGVQSDPSAQNVSALIMKYPEYGDQLKSGWEIKDKAAQDADLTQLGEVYSAAASGNWDLAVKQAKARIDADKASGNVDQGDQAMLDQINAAAGGDSGAQKNVLTLLGTHIAAISGPDHFASVFGALKGGYTLDAGATRYDENGNVVAHSPLIKGPDGQLYKWDEVMGAAPSGDSSSAPPGVSPSAASVASTLASAGLPGPVVAGFLGNFHAEGGYEGAQGDGGSASGIAQWRAQRAANFEKIVGKPVTDATPAEQAQFVAWEMQNPEAAGMTVKQRDAILNAKTPSQAAALIDQYYERSSGRDRQVRMDAANSFAHLATGGAVGSPKPLLPPKPKDAPAGFQWNSDQTKLEAIPGGPADPSAEALDPETTNFYAQEVLAGTPLSQLGFGMGKAAAANRRQVMQKVAKTAGAEGLNGRDLAVQVAHYRAGMSNVQNLEKQLGTIQGNEATFAANAQQVIARSRELPAQTGSRLLNTPIQSYLRQTNDPTVAALDVAIKTAANEYARLITASPSGAGTLTDNAREEYQGILQGNFPLKQKLAALQQMQRDAANRTTSLKGNLQDAYRHLTDRAPELRGDTASVPGIPKGAAIVGTYHGKRVIQLANGKRMVEQ